MTRQELRSSHPTFTCARPAPIRQQSVFSKLQAVGFGLPYLVPALVVGYLLHIVLH